MMSDSNFKVGDVAMLKVPVLHLSQGASYPVGTMVLVTEVATVRRRDYDGSVIDAVVRYSCLAAAADGQHRQLNLQTSDLAPVEQ